MTQVYEDETAIRLVLVNDTDKTNLNTAALATEPNGPCGAAACFTPAQIATCGGGTLSRNQIVLGQLVGAGNYDVGHIGLGVNGGGVAGLGVVGGASKARGCTGLPTPVGDFFAVDYVAHEIGHQFAGNHTFNGTQYNCSGGNRSAANSYEPGSGSSIMAYAGICQQDNLQPHSDPYWSQRSYTEITTFVGSARPAINEVQTVALRAFDTDGDSFTISYAGRESAPIVRGTNYTTAGLKSAIEAIPDWPAGATVTVAAFGGTGALDDTGFQVTFNGGPVVAVNVDPLAITAATGVSGSVGETVKGGAVDNGGWLVEETANRAPVVTVPASYTIPTRTPFSLTGSATDADGDTVTYMWEQNDRGGISGGSTAGTALVSNTKTNGPLFRQFGTAAVVSPADTLEYYSPGLNAVTTNPTRVFPDLAQIVANNTNAKTGSCPAAPPLRRRAGRPTCRRTSSTATRSSCPPPTGSASTTAGPCTSGSPPGTGTRVPAASAAPTRRWSSPRRPGRSWSPRTAPRPSRRRFGAGRHLGRGRHGRRADRRDRGEDLALGRQRRHLPARAGGADRQRRQRDGDPAERRHLHGEDQDRGGRQRLLRPERRHHHHPGGAAGLQRRTVRRCDRAVQRPRVAAGLGAGHRPGQ